MIPSSAPSKGTYFFVIEQLFDMLLNWHFILMQY
jgi:hypothetical protein